MPADLHRLSQQGPSRGRCWGSTCQPEKVTALHQPFRPSQTAYDGAVRLACPSPIIGQPTRHLLAAEPARQAALGLCRLLLDLLVGRVDVLHGIRLRLLAPGLGIRLGLGQVGFGVGNLEGSWCLSASPLLVAGELEPEGKVGWSGHPER